MSNDSEGQCGGHKSATRVQCRLDIKGTAKANADAIEDLGVDDPLPELAMAAIRKVMEGQGDDEAKGDDEQLLAEARPIIEAIAERKKRTGAFAYFQGDDIAQEVWVICLRAVEEYDATKGKLDHYLARCVENRLKNLRRDRYFRPPSDHIDHNGETRDRINIVNALPLGGGDIADNKSAVRSSMKLAQPCDILIAQELREQIAARLPKTMLPDFIRLLDGEKLTTPRTERIRAAVTAALEDING